MHPSTIILTLASAALIHAVAIPQPGPPPTRYDTCLDQYAQILGPEIIAGTAPVAGIAECTGCAGQAVFAGFLEYDPADPSTVQLAKDEYTQEMAACRGTTDDETYDTCINEYGQIFEFEPSADIAQCTGCAAQAVGAAFEVYTKERAEGRDGVDKAKAEYNDVMDYCRDTN